MYKNLNILKSRGKNTTSHIVKLSVHDTHDPSFSFKPREKERERENVSEKVRWKTWMVYTRLKKLRIVHTHVTCHTHISHT